MRACPLDYATHKKTCKFVLEKQRAKKAGEKAPARMPKATVPPAAPKISSEVNQSVMKMDDRTQLCRVTIDHLRAVSKRNP